MVIDCRVDLRDVTFLFLVRLDSIERLENTLATSQYLLSLFNTQIELLECAPYNNHVLENMLNPQVKYSFLKDQDPILHRTRFLNQMSSNVSSPFVAIWDVDVLCSKEQIMESVDLLRKKEVDFVYPYEKEFLETSGILRNLYIEKGDFEVLSSNQLKMRKLYLPNPLGGAFFVNTRSYIDSGLENESFYGWGLEDGERYHRWLTNEYRVKRIKGPIYHLTHPRGVNSMHISEYRNVKMKELLQATKKKNWLFADSITD